MTAIALPTDYFALSKLEWLETNGRGGYASGSVAGAGTRGYHGLIAAAIRSPAERTLLVTTCEEWLVHDQPAYLSSHQYPGTVHPDGWRAIESFSADPFPTWVYRLDTTRVERRVFMAHGENTTVVRYRLLAGAPTRLAVRPLFVFRDHHARREMSETWRVAATRSGSVVHCAPSDGGPALSIHFGDATYREDSRWFRQFEYLRELERGLAFREDAYSACVLELSLAPDRSCDLVFTAEDKAPRAAEAMLASETKRRRAMVASVPKDDALGQRLAAATDAYVVHRGARGRSVIAGYPWFGDWGRDAMIALPGLTLITGRLDDAARVLTTFADNMRDGLLPNRFSDVGVEPEYNTVDASLWFAVALHHFRGAGGDAALADGPLGAALERIVTAYAQGTHFGIHEDSDGLVVAGAEGVALTWMDARVGDRVITPRRGKAVEINALWYNARRILGDIQSRRGKKRDAAKTRRLAERTREAFLTTFWDESTGSLYDVIAPEGRRDASIRPNQLFGASLPYALLSRAQATRMVQFVATHLLTPRGLRTLAPGDPAYLGHYEGGPETRDAAYHQGTVWPWLLGAFVDASLYGERDTAAARARLQPAFAGLREHLDEACLGQISEIFDGDAPHAPHGCPAQAWSVAEALRAWRRLAAPRARASTKVTQ